MQCISLRMASAPSSSSAVNSASNRRQTGDGCEWIVIPRHCHITGNLQPLFQEKAAQALRRARTGTYPCIHPQRKRSITAFAQIPEANADSSRASPGVIATAFAGSN